MPNLFEEFRAVVAGLTEARIPFAVCGGLAMAIHAEPRATVDIDLMAPAEEMSRLVEVLVPLGFVRRERSPLRLARGEVRMHRFTKVTPGDPDVLILDVIEAGSGTPARAWQGRIDLGWEGQTISVVSRDGLVALKRLRGSAQDLADIARLEGQA